MEVVAETDGPEVIVAVLVGAVVSMVHDAIAADPVLPAPSRRCTAKECEPSASDEVVSGDVQVVQAPLSIRHSYVSPVTAPPNVKVPVARALGLAGLVRIVGVADGGEDFLHQRDRFGDGQRASALQYFGEGQSLDQLHQQGWLG